MLCAYEQTCKNRGHSATGSRCAGCPQAAERHRRIIADNTLPGSPPRDVYFIKPSADCRDPEMLVWIDQYRSLRKNLHRVSAPVTRTVCITCPAQELGACCRERSAELTEALEFLDEYEELEELDEASADELYYHFEDPEDLEDLEDFEDLEFAEMEELAKTEAKIKEAAQPVCKEYIDPIARTKAAEISAVIAAVEAREHP